MVNQTPSVSVIMPAYNAASLISEALNSVLAQTYREFEVIVINDGSPDTQDLEESVRPFLEDIVYIRQDNRRAAGARNTGIRRARGQFLAFLDADDSWTPEYLESQMKLFEQTPSLDVVYSDAFYYSDSQSPGRRYMETCPSRGPATLEALLLERCHVCISCTVARKQIILRAGLFDENLPRCDDYDMWLRVASCGGKIGYQQKALGWIRPGRPGSLGESQIKMHEAAVQILHKLEGWPVLQPSARGVVTQALARERALVALERGKAALSTGAFGEAGDALREANAFFQNSRLRLALLGLQIAPRVTWLGARVWDLWRRT
jgi:hypothetical protein